MRKIKPQIMLFLVVCLLAFGSICFASIPKEDLELGNIHYGDDLKDVEATYGEPAMEHSTFRHALWKGVIREARYGDSFLVTYRGSNVIFLQSFGDNNGIETGKGLAVGMTINDAEEMYGEPDIKLTKRWIWTADDYTGLAVSFHPDDGRIFFISVGALD